MKIRDARSEGQEIRRILVEHFGNPFGLDFVSSDDFESQQIRKIAREASRSSKAARKAFFAGG